MREHFDWGKNVRQSDGSTSREAAMRAHPDDKMAAIVQRVLSDGRGRIDEEIAFEGARMGHDFSPDRFRHGRKRLQEQGLLVTREKHNTNRNRPSRVWILRSAENVLTS